MPAPIWPPGLPQSPLVASFQETLPAVALRSPMDAGPAKSRRRFTTGPTPVQISLYLTRAQVAIFKAFHDDTCEGGAIWFEWTNHRTKAAALYRFTDEPTLVPKAASDGDGKVWQVSFPAEFVPLPDDPGPGNPPGGDAPSLELPPTTESIGEATIEPTLLEPVADPNSGWVEPAAVTPVAGVVLSIDNADAASPSQPEFPMVAPPDGPKSPVAIPGVGTPTSVSAEGAGAGAAGAGWSGW